MPKRKRSTWLMQLTGCANKGRAAYEQGQPRSACPYGDPQMPYRGGSVNKQRRQYWQWGWDNAARDAAAAQDSIRSNAKEGNS